MIAHMPIAAHRNALRRPIVATCAALALFASAGSARADDDENPPDARLLGYNPAIEIGGGVAGSFALLALGGAIAVGVCFKNANRSHLD